MSDTPKIDPIKNEEALYQRFLLHNICWTTHSHQPIATVAQSHIETENLPGLHIKNLFLRDKKRQFFLLSASALRPIDLKRLRIFINARGNLSFGDKQILADLLGVLPGSVTPFAIMHDKQNQVKILLDKALIDAGKINAHPMRNDRSTVVSSKDLLKFLERENHKPDIIDFDSVSFSEKEL